jgi:hypothetical protein
MKKSAQPSRLTKTGVGVEKVRQRSAFSSCEQAVVSFLVLVRLSGSRQDRLAEKAHQSLDILSCRCQEELLAHEPKSPQTQAP